MKKDAATLTPQEIEKRIAESYELPNNVLKAIPKPMVTVRTSAYQHEPYIKQCIESIIGQKTNFDFEFIIGEDFSTDGTREIVFEYAQKYPNLIRVITADRNVGIKANGYRCIRAMRGKYIAICEGDDYWTDPYKLQKQVDFMEKHPDYALCFHPVRVLFEKGEQAESIFPPEKDGFTIENLIRRNFIQTNSVLYRHRENEGEIVNVMPGDYFMHLRNARFGKIGFIDEVMSIYRRHTGGIWWQDSQKMSKFWIKHAEMHINFFKEVESLFKSDRKLLSIVRETETSFIDSVVGDCMSDEEGQDLIKELIIKTPETFGECIINNYKELRRVDNEKNRLQSLNDELNARLDASQKAISDLRSQLEMYEFSRPHRILEDFLRWYRNTFR